MAHDLLIAATQSHGPPHILVVGVLPVAIVGWLVYRAVMGRRRSDGDSQSGRGPAGTRSVGETPESDRGPGS